MKNLLKFTLFLTILISFVIMSGSAVVAQTTQEKKSNSIPADVMKVLDKSCAACHKDGGMKMAQGPLNISGWDTYAPEKQAAKANAMCKVVTKGSMPPKKFKANNAGKVPTADDVKIICNWATSLQTAQK